MADLDTRSKRASSVGILLTPILAPPLPDGAFDQGDRQHIAWSYSGIAAGGAVAALSDWLLRARRRWIGRGKGR